MKLQQQKAHVICSEVFNTAIDLLMTIDKDQATARTTRTFVYLHQSNTATSLAHQTDTYTSSSSSVAAAAAAAAVIFNYTTETKILILVIANNISHKALRKVVSWQCLTSPLSNKKMAESSV